MKMELEKELSNENTDYLLNDFDLEDEDTCSTEEINMQFSNRYISVKSLNVCSEGVSCSALLADNFSDSFATVLSNKSVSVIDKNTFKIKSAFHPHKKEVTDIKFSPKNSNLIYTSSLTGEIVIWDSRSNKLEKTIDTNTEKRRKPITTFDISPNEKVLCAGTELVGEDSFLLFWDIRGDKLIGGYWESHSDDITCVKFNPENPKLMGSSGSDALLNVFDLSHSSEANALTYCLNTKDIVNTFCWRNENKKSNILCHTDVRSIQLWDIEEVSASSTFSRDNLTKSLKRSLSYECYPIPINYSTFSKNPIILAGSGLEHESNSCLRTLKINEKRKILEPHGTLITENNNISSVVQVASCNSDLSELITVREDGIISLWKSKSADINESLKVKNKFKNKLKPY